MNRKPPAVNIPCKRCSGTGRRRLTAAYATTLSVVPWTWTDTGEINKELPNVKRPALCNRLASLLREHLVERRDHPSDAKQLQWRRQ